MSVKNLKALWKNRRMTPLLCARGVVITLETPKSKKGTLLKGTYLLLLHHGTISQNDQNSNQGREGGGGGVLSAGITGKVLAHLSQNCHCQHTGEACPAWHRSWPAALMRLLYRLSSRSEQSDCFYNTQTTNCLKHKQTINDKMDNCICGHHQPLILNSTNPTSTLNLVRA